MNIPTTASLYKPCIKAVGPLNAKIMLIGEAPGETEEQMGIPFVGSSGHLLDDMLKQAEILRRDCYLTNVFFTRPPQNKLEKFCVSKKEPGAVTSMPALSKGGYIRNDFLPELERLRHEIQSVRPAIIICLGNTAAWAVLRQTSISKIRGTIVQSQYGIKALPTYHPAAIFRQWELRPIVVADLMKAKIESEFAEIRRPERIIIVDPSFDDIAEFYYKAERAPLMSVDIETKKGQITCIGFAISKSLALVIPFVDERRQDKNHWGSLEAECRAMWWTQKLLNLPAGKIFQNGLYDLQYLRKYRFTVANCIEDTMLLHHALHPELLKGLGFMGSVYTSEPAWKLMRQRGEEVLKRDE